MKQNIKNINIILVIILTLFVSGWAQAQEPQIIDIGNDPVEKPVLFEPEKEAGIGGGQIDEPIVKNEIVISQNQLPNTGLNTAILIQCLIFAAFVTVIVRLQFARLRL